MAAPELPSGIYRIIVTEAAANVADGINISEPKCLTAQEGSVILSPPNAEDAPKQQWQIRSGEDSTIVIHRPSQLSFPLSYLTYEGISGNPQPGDRIVVANGLDFPPNEWRAEVGSECLYLIRVAGTDLSIAVSETRLELTRGQPLEFVFQREAEA